MNCTEFRALITAGIENRELLPPRVNAHLDTCRDPRCRAQWDEAVLLQRAIESWLSTQTTIDFADAVVSAWRAENEAAAGSVRVLRSGGERSRPTGANVIVALSVAALALVAVLLNPSGSDRVVTHRGKPSLHQAPSGDAGLAYVTYAQNAAQIVTDAVVLTLGGAEQMEDPKVEPIPIGWEADWPPMGEVHAALDELIKSLPPDPPSS